MSEGFGVTAGPETPSSLPLEQDIIPVPTIAATAKAAKVFTIFFICTPIKNTASAASHGWLSIKNSASAAAQNAE